MKRSGTIVRYELDRDDIAAALRDYLTAVYGQRGEPVFKFSRMHTVEDLRKGLTVVMEYTSEDTDE